MQGGFQRAGKQRPDGTQIPAQRHPPSRVCTAPMLICSREGFSLCWTSAAVPGRHPSSPAGLLHHAPGQVPALFQVSLTHSLSSHSQAPADGPGLLQHRQKGWGSSGAQQCWAGGMWHHWTPLQQGRGEGLLLTPPAQAAEVAAEDARHALAHVLEHLAPSPGLQCHQDAPSPGCKILSWLIQLALLTLLPPHPAAFPAPGGN